MFSADSGKFWWDKGIKQATEGELRAEIDRRRRERSHKELVEELALHMLRNPEDVEEISEGRHLGSTEMDYTIELRK